MASIAISGVLPEPLTRAGDNALISAYVAGNEYAFEVLLSRYQNKLVNYINTLLQDYDTAVDLAQEAFIRVYRNADQYQSKYQFSTWIYRIATNLAIDEIRRRQRKQRFFFEPVCRWIGQQPKQREAAHVSNSPERTLVQKETLNKLQCAINSLPEPYRLAFILKEVQELSYEETAHVLSVSPGTAKSRVHRAKLLLREKLAGVL